MKTYNEQTINFDKYLNEFTEKVSWMNYEDNGMFNSEIFLLYVLYKEINCNMVIESGIDNGVSTKRLLNLIEDDYVGIDINQNCNGSNLINKNFKFLYGDSNKLINEIIENNNKNIFVIIDGPKGQIASRLKDELLENDKIKIVAIHDTYDGLENENHLRVFESKNNERYNKKYFKLLNDNSEISIFNKLNYPVENNLTYSQTFPDGPGISVYSKLNFNFIY
jgi:hypothetical protein